LAVNVRAPHVLVAELAPVMVAHGMGRVIAIGSWMASVGTSIAGFYGATKAAEEQLTRSWAAEFGSRGVRFAGIAPGITRDPADGVDAGVQQMTAAPPALP
jgi:3-oxoacyl-[acyl-carrier protein] reductase